MTYNLLWKSWKFAIGLLQCNLHSESFLRVFSNRATKFNAPKWFIMYLENTATAPNTTYHYTTSYAQKKTKEEEEETLLISCHMFL